MKIYRTSELAKIIGVHPNTIRFYEEVELLPVVPREGNGYRIFNEMHLNQLYLLRAAFRSVIISSNLRNEAVEIVKKSARGEWEEAYHKTQLYLEHLLLESSRAEEAIGITEDILKDHSLNKSEAVFLGRKEAAEMLDITVDVLRDWERNGLIHVPRGANGYRRYGSVEMNRLKIIRTLRSAHYSMMAILRMLIRLDEGDIRVRDAINTPGEEEDIVCAQDQYLTALHGAKEDAREMLEILRKMMKSPDQETS